VGPISGAPFGSAGILTIPWSYIQLMGGAGLTEATQMAILSANYLAKKLDPLFPVLYKGREGFIAHECIIDIRPLNKSVGVSVDDIAIAPYGWWFPCSYSLFPSSRHVDD